MKIGISSCLLGTKCNYKGEDILSNYLKSLDDNYDDIKFVKFCPEESVFGTPRSNAKIIGGDGNDVLDGSAKVFNEQDIDVTDQYIKAANNFLKVLKDKEVEAVFLTEGSPSCGVNVILKDEGWPRSGFKKGVGVTTALLIKNNIKVIGSFDEKLINKSLSVGIEDINVDEGLKNLADNPKFSALLS